MPFQAVCCCPRHNEWKHGKVNGEQLRQCTREEASVLNLASEDPKNKGRKRKICVSCRSRLHAEVKCQKLEEICTRAQFGSSNASTCNVIDVVSDLVVTPALMMPDEVEASTSGDSLSTSCVADVLHESDILEARAEPTAHFPASSVATSCDRGTQKPPVRKVPYKELSDWAQRLVRADVIELMRDEVMKTVHFVPEDMSEFMNELLQNKNFRSVFGLDVDNQDICNNQTLQSLVKEYRACMDKEQKREARRRSLKETGKICIGNSLRE